MVRRGDTIRIALFAELRRRRWVTPLAAVLVYLVVAVLAYWPVEPISSTQLVGCACGDQVQEVWFLAWVTHALTHGLNPLFSSGINYPYGVNLADNTSMPLLGLLASPITLLHGPVAAYNAMLRIGFAASAASMCFVVKRFTTRWFPAFLAGLLYGFSPYMVGEGNGHLFLVFVPLPPLIALCVVELCRADRSSLRRWGLTLGALAVAQFLISIEVLLTTALACAIGVVASAIVRPRAARAQLSRFLTGIAWALVVFVPLVAYPTYYFFDGPLHVVGPPQSVAALAPYRADLLGPIVPTVEQRFAPSHLAAIGSSFAGGNFGEDGSYLGIPLVLALCWAIVRFRRDLLLVTAAFVGFCCYVLSLGTPLTVDNHSTGVTLPFDVLTKLPGFEGILPARFSLYVQLCAAFVLAIATDRLLAGAPQLARRDLHRPRPGRRFLIGAVAAGVLVPLVPHFPYTSSGVNAPSYFTSGLDRAIPTGSAVVTYPYDVTPNNEGMLWEALSGMRFSIVGGEDTRPGPGGTGTSVVDPLAPTELQNLFRAAFDGSASPVPAPPASAKGYERVREFFTRWKIDAVVVQPVGADPNLAVNYLTKVFGRGPEVTGGVDVWYLDRRK